MKKKNIRYNNPQNRTSDSYLGDCRVATVVNGVPSVGKITASYIFTYMGSSRSVTVDVRVLGGETVPNGSSIMITKAIYNSVMEWIMISTNYRVPIIYYGQISSLSPFQVQYKIDGGTTITIAVSIPSSTGYVVNDYVFIAIFPWWNSVSSAIDWQWGILQTGICAGLDADISTISNTNDSGSSAKYARADHTHKVIPRWQPLS